MKQTNKNETKQCHACLNVQTTLTPMADFVDINGYTRQPVQYMKATSTIYPMLNLCDVCVNEYNEMMQYFVSWATKPANHCSYYY